ncbi:pectinesterase family protein [Vibrio gangliei]|uniref:pectinesterase family protein n=1 Tax=Vibrio gangliei TaxID=2077090 RepID=UPI000D011DF8|nr:pectinesterase family protein [Vibrio gangliei]
MKRYLALAAIVTLPGCYFEKLEMLPVCRDMTDLYVCDDFNQNNLTKWQLLATDGGDPDGVFDVPKGEGYLRYTAGSKGGEILLASPKSIQKVLPYDDYFIEARIRPRQNSTTANKQLYFFGRYQEAGSWIAGGLNLQNSPTSTKAEMAISEQASISRPSQTSMPIYLGAKDGTDDGTWYKVRFDMEGNDLTLYLDGEKISTMSLPTTNTDFSQSGPFGIFTNNRSFEIDYIKIGNPELKPVLLVLDYKQPTWDSAIAGGESLDINVTAMQSDGVTADTFTVTSSDTSIVQVDTSGNMVSLIPLAVGEASVTFQSGSDPTLAKTIQVNVEAPFVMPSESYNLTGKTFPAINSVEQAIDPELLLTFDNTPALGEKGEVRIYRSSDDQLVDTLLLTGDINQLGYKTQDKVRTVNQHPIYLDGNTLRIQPHSDVLDYGENYYVVVGDGLVTGATLDGKAFVGLGKSSQWSFMTKSTLPSGDQITVGKDASNDFSTLQAAFNFIMKNSAADTPVNINLAAGTYRELLYLANKHNVTISGVSPEDTIIEYDNYETLNSGSGKGSAPGAVEGGRSVFLVESSDMLTLENLTLRNSHVRSNSASNQAEAIYFNANDKQRLIAKNIHFESEQDTLQLKGYSWFYHSLIAGNVDFIWGNNNTALFEESEIRTIGDSKDGTGLETSGGYVLQARTVSANDLGFVFLNSTFTHGIGPVGNTISDASTYFARSAGYSNYFDNIILINSKVDSHIADIGWAVEGINGQPKPNPSEPTATTGWREFNTMNIDGEPMALENRQGVYILNQEEAQPYLTREAIFSNYNGGAGWNPQP